MDNIIPETPTQKQCNRCKHYFPATKDWFFGDRSKKDGLTTLCQTCKRTPKPIPLPVPDGYKRCRTCNEVKLATTEFFNATAFYASEDLLNKQCRDCRLAYRNNLYKSKPVTPIPQSQEKICRDCQQTFPATLEYFTSNRAYRDRLNGCCKNCDQERTRQYRLRPGGKQYRQAYRKLRSAIDNEYHRQYRIQHSEDTREYHRQYRIGHQEEERNYRRMYRATERCKARLRVNNSKRRARLMRAKGVYTPQDIKEQYNRQHGKCYYCHTKLGQGRNTYHADHIVPLSRGGTNDKSNIVLACPPCNLSKGDKLLHEWERGGKLI